MNKRRSRTWLGVALLVVALAIAAAMGFGFVMFDDREGPRPGAPPVESPNAEPRQ